MKSATLENVNGIRETGTEFEQDRVATERQDRMGVPFFYRWMATTKKSLSRSRIGLKGPAHSSNGWAAIRILEWSFGKCPVKGQAAPPLAT